MESNLNEKLSKYKLNRVHGPVPRRLNEQPFCFELIWRVVENGVEGVAIYKVRPNIIEKKRKRSEKFGFN